MGVRLAMKRLHINLATPSRVTPILLWLLTGALLLSAAFVGWMGWAVAQEARTMTDEAEAFRAKQVTPQSDVSSPPLYAADAQALLHLAAADLSQVLVAIESAAVPGVRISRLEVNALTRRVTLEIDAPDHLLALQLLEQLQAQSTSLSWQVESSQANANAGVQMVVGGGW